MQFGKIADIINLFDILSFWHLGFGQQAIIE
jgi:hypothetical protein